MFYSLEEYALLKSLRCGGYTEVLQDAVVWFSSGGTKSVLHFDSVDNINCLFDGTKELLMINKVTAVQLILAFIRDKLKLKLRHLSH